MTELIYLTRRNTKLFFKDKGMFFTAMATPLILVLLFMTFLGNVYRSSVTSSAPEGLEIPSELVEGFVGGFLFSSLLAVCCVTVSFCANMLMVQDRAIGARRDLTMSPVKPWVLSLSYYLSTTLVTLIICFVALAVCFVYLAVCGWYLSAADIVLTILDVFLLVMFGTALSSFICAFLSTQGQISAVTGIISACYGFLCGAYMPLSQFSEGLRNALAFLPGTYGTALLHTHLMRGTISGFEELNCPQEYIDALFESYDNSIFFFDNEVTIPTMYLILGAAVVVLLIAYVLTGICRNRSKN